MNKINWNYQNPAQLVEISLPDRAHLSDCYLRNVYIYCLLRNVIRNKLDITLFLFVLQLPMHFSAVHAYNLNHRLNYIHLILIKFIHIDVVLFPSITWLQSTYLMNDVGIIRCSTEYELIPGKRIKIVSFYELAMFSLFKRFLSNADTHKVCLFKLI